MEWGEDSQEFAAYSAHFQSHSQRTLDPMGVLRWEEKIERRKQANKKGKVGRRKEMGEEGGETEGKKAGKKEEVAGGIRRKERRKRRRAGPSRHGCRTHGSRPAPGLFPARSRLIPGSRPAPSRPLLPLSPGRGRKR